MKKRLLFTFLAFMLMTITVSAKPREDYGSPYAVFEGDKGIKVVSYTSTWNSEEKLQKVYDELLLNFHSNELNYLSHIYLYPDSPEGVAGLYHTEYSINSNGEYEYHDKRYIELFDIIKHNEVEDFAGNLSHEYGHHFTMFHLIQGENKFFADLYDTGYAKVRNFEKYPNVKHYSDLEGLDYSHKWDVTEIAAEDYVQLFGSKTAKKSTDYKDITEKIRDNQSEYYTTSNSFNLFPQENLDIPLAANVDGLYEYWLNLAGYTSKLMKPDEFPKLTLLETERVITPELMEKYNFESFRNKDFNKANKKYAISWEKIPDGKNYEYTLVGFPGLDRTFPEPIKTVNSNEVLIAYFGSMKLEDETGSIKLLIDEYEGLYEFKLFIKDENDFIFESEPLIIDFGEIDRVYEDIFEDVNHTHWASFYISDLVRKGIINGYEDNKFRPENTISRAEFLTMIVKTIRNSEISEVENATHWFERFGYYDYSKKLNLIREADYGKDFKFFAADDPITREEMAFIGARFLDLSMTRTDLDYRVNFVDNSNIAYKKELNIISKYNVINGYPDRTFRPSNSTKRAEAAKVISKIYDLTSGWIVKEKSDL